MGATAEDLEPSKESGVHDCGSNSTLESLTIWSTNLATWPLFVGDSDESWWRYLDVESRSGQRCGIFHLTSQIRL
ncbi:hypothetical protein H5410_063231 [Solanum commersonii]|uniref:Uncharacterized protein n=1 Tax=Solanum commersonii TaxID=4109 RepID=A0A9J5WCQ0_SOLCO|nr:hypothetical protein H5410_063231 [Solanum commersonii]